MHSDKRKFLPLPAALLFSAPLPFVCKSCFRVSSQQTLRINSLCSFEKIMFDPEAFRDALVNG